MALSDGPEQKCQIQNWRQGRRAAVCLCIRINTKILTSRFQKIPREKNLRRKYIRNDNLKFYSEKIAFAQFIGAVVVS